MYVYWSNPTCTDLACCHIAEMSGRDDQCRLTGFNLLRTLSSGSSFSPCSQLNRCMYNRFTSPLKAPTTPPPPPHLKKRINPVRIGELDPQADAKEAKRLRRVGRIFQGSSSMEAFAARDVNLRRSVADGELLDCPRYSVEAGVVYDAFRAETAAARKCRVAPHATPLKADDVDAGEYADTDEVSDEFHQYLSIFICLSSKMTRHSETKFSMETDQSQYLDPERLC